MRSQSLAANYLPESRESVTRQPLRVARHGGMVGEMLKQIEDHMADPSAAIVFGPTLSPRVDAVHFLSVAAGYVGLAFAFGTAAIIVNWLL